MESLFDLSLFDDVEIREMALAAGSSLVAAGSSFLLQVHSLVTAGSSFDSAMKSTILYSLMIDFSPRILDHWNLHSLSWDVK